MPLTPGRVRRSVVPRSPSVGGGSQRGHMPEPKPKRAVHSVGAFADPSGMGGGIPVPMRTLSDEYHDRADRARGLASRARTRSTKLRAPCRRMAEGQLEVVTECRAGGEPVHPGRPFAGRYGNEAYAGSPTAIRRRSSQPKVRYALPRDRRDSAPTLARRKSPDGSRRPGVFVLAGGAPGLRGCEGGVPREPSTMRRSTTRASRNPSASRARV